MKDWPPPTKTSTRNWEPMTRGERGLGSPFWVYARVWVFLPLAEPRNPPAHLHGNEIILCSLMSCAGKRSGLQVCFPYFSLSTLNTAASQGSSGMPPPPHTFPLKSSAFMVFTNTQSPEIFPDEPLRVLLSFDLLYLPACWPLFKLGRPKLNSPSPTSTPQACCPRSPVQLDATVSPKPEQESGSHSRFLHHTVCSIPTTSTSTQALSICLLQRTCRAPAHFTSTSKSDFCTVKSLWWLPTIRKQPVPQEWPTKALYRLTPIHSHRCHCPPQILPWKHGELSNLSCNTKTTCNSPRVECSFPCLCLSKCCST